jgi:hypothetical protein
MSTIWSLSKAKRKCRRHCGLSDLCPKPTLRDRLVQRVLCLSGGQEGGLMSDRRDIGGLVSFALWLTATAGWGRSATAPSR